MLGFQDFTSTNNNGNWGVYYDPLMTTTWFPDFHPPYSYGTTAGAIFDSNANDDQAVVDSLLSEAWGVLQGVETSVAAPMSLSPSPNTTNVGSVGVGHQTGDPEVDSLLNQTDEFISETGSWLDSLTTTPKDDSTSMVSLFQSVGQQVSTILNPNTTDVELNNINSTNKKLTQQAENQAMLGQINKSINKGEQRLNDFKFESIGSLFNHGYIYGDDGYAIAYQDGDEVSPV